MKSKNIPADIREKTLKEAQNEIKDIISKLEDSGIKLEDSLDQYNRVIQLNHHIQEQFKRKANKIKESALSKDQKSLSKNLK